MAFNYTNEFVKGSLTYNDYRQSIEATLAQPPKDENAEKMRPYLISNFAFMNQYYASSKISDGFQSIIKKSPAVIWLVITEGWCGDAAFNIPTMAIIEKAIPNKIELRFVLRDTNLEFMDEHLTNGGRSIPKLIVLSNDLKEIGTWGPRPKLLQTLMGEWKSAGLELMDIIPKVHAWYHADNIHSLQNELETLIKSYS